MSNWLKLTDEEKREILEATAAALGVPPFVVEKDWWVTLCLRAAFATFAGPHLLFKGGTSLSKAWNIIDRFSEDIDLAIDREYLGFSGDLSRTQVGKLRKASQTFVSGNFYEELTELLKPYGVKLRLEETTHSDQDPFKIFVEYPNLFPHSQYVHPRVTLEVGARSLREPFEARDIQSFTDARFPDRPFTDAAFSIPCVNVERTFLEKLFLLHEEFQRPEDKRRVERLSRHLYDIYRISLTPFAKAAMADKSLYSAIVEHREHFTRMEGVDYTSHFPPNLNPIPPAEVLHLWESDYKTMQQEMILGDSPSFEALLQAIKDLMKEINED